MWTLALQIAGPIILWLLRRAGASEESIKLVRLEIQAVQKGRSESTRPAEEEAEAERRLKEKLGKEKS